MSARELTETDRKDLRKRLLRGVRLVLQGDPGVTLSGQPVEDFIAGAAPSNPFSAFQHRAGRAACDRWARRSRGSILPGRDVYFRNLCGEYLGAGLPGSTTTGPPFTGGQCAFDYSVFYFTTRPADGARLPATGFDNTGAGRVPGPIRGTYNDFRNPGGSSGFLVNPTYNPGFGVALGRYPVWFMGTDNLIVTISTVQPWDGVSPDNCGNPPPLFNPGTPNPTADPNPGPIGGPTGYGFPGFDVQINPDGSVDITFGDGSNPVTIDPGLGLDQPPLPGDLGEPGTSANTGAGGDAEGEAPEGQVLVGLKLGILSTPPQAKEFQEGFYRGSVYIFMGAADGLDMDFAGSIVRNNQFVLAEKDNLTKWFVAANPGYNFSVTPYYRDAE